MKKKNKLPLNQVDRKIDLSMYTTQEYSDFLSSFKDTIINIKYKDEDEEKIITIKLTSSQLPHLIGLHHAYDSVRRKKYYKGLLGIQTLKMMTFSDVEYNIKNNNINYNGKQLDWNKDIKPRFEYLPCALNTICSKYSLKVQKEHESDRNVNTVLKGKYFYYKADNNNYLIFSIAEKDGEYYFETFIVNDGLLLLGVLDKLEVIEVTVDILDKK